MASVTISQLSKSFGATKVLRDASLEIADGEFLTLLGPSGCGKSTLLRLIAGLEVQDTGSIAIGGAAVDALRPKQRNVAMVFQTYALYPHLTVAENIAMPLRMRRLSLTQRLPLVGGLLPGVRAVRDGIHRDVAAVANALEIDHLLDRKPGQLSGGQRQRVAVGRAMVRQPAVFLMDEPLSNLDAKLRVQMRAEIAALHRRLGATFIYVTHDQIEAMTMSDRVAVMLDGELLQVATPKEIYADPADRRVAEFIGSPKINMLTARVRDAASVEIAGAVMPLATRAVLGTELQIGLRPELFRPLERAAETSLTGPVRFVEHMGSDTFIHVALAGERGALVARLPADSQGFAVGETVHLGFNPDRALVFARDGTRLRKSESNTLSFRRAMS